jgi:uncharacterized membrane protein YcfT
MSLSVHPLPAEHAAKREKLNAGSTDWLNIAKGIGILMVVLWHVALYWPEQNEGVTLMVRLKKTFVLVAMPLFFFTAGSVAQRKLKGSWKLFWEQKFFPLFWIYLLWSALFFALVELIPALLRGVSLPVVEGSFLVTTTNLWFIYALAIICLCQKLSLALPRWVSFSSVIVIYIAALLIQNEPALDLLHRIGKNLPFFFMGYHGRLWLKRLLLGRSYLWLGFMPLFFWIKRLLYQSPDVLSYPLSFLTSLLGIAFIVNLSWAVQSTWLGNQLRTLGRNSLYLYLIHFLYVYLLIHLYANLPLKSGAFAMLVVFAGSISLSLLTKRLLLKLRLGWLFHQPALHGFTKPSNVPVRVLRPITPSLKIRRGIQRLTVRASSLRTK